VAQVMIEVDPCTLREKALELAWKALKEFFKGREREKKERSLDHSKVRIQVFRKGEIFWIDENDIREIKVTMEVWR
jgi:hypothetical protein